MLDLIGTETEMRKPVAQVGTERDGYSGHYLLRRITAATSAKGKSIGASGLWTVTVTAETRGRDRTDSAMRLATFSIRFQRSLATKPATSIATAE